MLRFGGKEVPPQDRKHSVPCSIHRLTGVGAALAMAIAPAWGEWHLVVPLATVPALVCARDSIEFLRRGDEPGWVLADHRTGFCVGLILGVILLPTCAPLRDSADGASRRPRLPRDAHRASTAQRTIAERC